MRTIGIVIRAFGYRQRVSQTAGQQCVRVCTVRPNATAGSWLGGMSSRLMRNNSEAEIEAIRSELIAAELLLDSMKAGTPPIPRPPPCPCP